ncbi:formimidoylglutamase [Pedobacter sp. SL55]|uniref:formimidoylglutamase n=1 Tax=Pedobacter sp. SL55 TaxID=2995161 RepID=UPI0022709E34|nr:formimidoylglutamase [Pedobacter sp. SL55]WAC41828.1 formimidoylglutamase [Pedobacter sp. SL55]
MEKFTMDSFQIFSKSDILSLVNKRDGETKLGQNVVYYPHGVISTDGLKQSPARFVLLGIPEDIGVRANYGIGGAHTAWRPALKTLLNLQQNQFLKGQDLLVLGEFNIPANNTTDINELRKTVAEIDDLVYPIIQAIVAAGKVPIVIGGGHNNCYPIIKGTSQALKTTVNVLNIDAHTDLRNTDEGRHSGNGFSTALEEGFLEQYRMLGVHQNYLSEAQQQFISENSAVKAFYFDDLLAYQQDLNVAAQILLNGVKQPLALEIDLDSICGVLASASTPSGFSLNEIRQLLLQLQKNFTYLHICEGAYQLNNGRKDETIGKTIAYLVSDFMKSS